MTMMDAPTATFISICAGVIPGLVSLLYFSVKFGRQEQATSNQQKQLDDARLAHHNLLGIIVDLGRDLGRVEGKLNGSLKH